MKITIEFDSNNKDEMDTVLAALSASPVGKDAAPAETKATDAAAKKAADAATKKVADAEAKKAADAAAKKKADEEAAAAKKAAEEAEDAGDDDESSEFSRDDVRAKLKEHAALEGKEAAIQILKAHGAASITELAEDKFANVIAACG